MQSFKEGRSAVDYGRPDPSQLKGPGWFQDVAGNTCFSVGQYLVVIHKWGTDGAVWVRLLEPDDDGALWKTMEEQECRTHGAMCDAARDMIACARQDFYVN